MNFKKALNSKVLTTESHIDLYRNFILKIFREKFSCILLIYLLKETFFFIYFLRTLKNKEYYNKNKLATK